MKKILLCSVLMLMAAGVVRAQEKPAQAPMPKYIYCKLVEVSKVLSTKMNVSIDFGQEASGIFDLRRLRDKQGNILTFNSMVDAMNFMSADGWEFVQAYVVVSGNSSDGTGSVVSEVNWLLRLDTVNLSSPEKERILKKLNTEKPRKR